MNELEVLKNIDKKLSAILILIIQGRGGQSEKGDRKTTLKAEVFLAGAGLSASDIAKLLNKKVPAVQKTIQRARK